MGKCRSEAFASFIHIKELELNDLGGVVDYCAHKVSFLHEFFSFKLAREGGINLTEVSCNGLTRILGEIEEDLYLISDEINVERHEKPVQVNS